MKAKKMKTAKELSVAFSNILMQWLGEEQMREIIELTKKETDPGICHTGDYCDSNMAMHAAFVAAGLMKEESEEDEDDESSYGGMNEELTSLWNASWDLAKANLFYVPEPMSTQELKDYLSKKYPNHAVAIINKDENYSDHDEAPEQLIQITTNDFSIVDLFSSECGRFHAEPFTTYGIEKKDADLIRMHNKLSF
jgi:hypothetical protein